MEVIYRLRRACRMFRLGLRRPTACLDIHNLKPGQTAMIARRDDGTICGSIRDTTPEESVEVQAI